VPGSETHPDRGVCLCRRRRRVVVVEAALANDFPGRAALERG